MNKCLVTLLVILGLTACSARDKHYYQAHPNELQQALSVCPEQQPRGLTCQQLAVLAERMNKLAYQLQLSPQDFGKKIIVLQESIFRQERAAQSEDANTDLQAKLTENKSDLAEHLAVVKWLESPAS